MLNQAISRVCTVLLPDLGKPAESRIPAGVTNKPSIHTLKGKGENRVFKSHPAQSNSLGLKP